MRDEASGTGEELYGFRAGPEEGGPSTGVALVESPGSAGRLASGRETVERLEEPGVVGRCAGAEPGTPSVGPGIVRSTRFSASPRILGSCRTPRLVSGYIHGMAPS